MKVKGIGIGTNAVALAAAALVLVAGLDARAQSCAALANEIRTHAPGWSLEIGVVSAQANKISTYSIGTIKWDPQTQRIVTYWEGQQTFSDRRYYIFDNSGVPTRLIAQNFAISPPSSVEKTELFMSSNGSSVSIHNLTWNYWISINNPTCSDGVLYGFGTPVGNANGGRPAMYIIARGQWIGDIG